MGGGMALTPAQSKMLQAAQSSMSNFQKTWLPVQSYYSQYLATNQSPLSQQAQGEATGAARAKATGAMLHDAAVKGARAGVGSGGFESALGSAANEGGAYAGRAGTSAALNAQQAYESGLANLVNVTNSDQSLANKGLSTAANVQGAEQQAAVQQGQGNLQGLGQLAGLGVALIR